MKYFQQTKHALGSTAMLTVVSDQAASAEKLLANLWAKVDEFEARFSRFRDSSELSHFNKNAGKLVPVSVDFRRLLARAKHLAAETDGLYNPFILPALQRAGYVSSWPETGQATKLNYSSRQIRKPGQLELFEQSARIPADSAVDLGGIGKGYLLDRLAELADGKCQGYWFSLGGDIICAGFDKEGKPWRLGIDTAQQTGKSVAAVQNYTGERLALTTSGILKRAGSNNGTRWHHLIDPRTGQPAETDILTASVIGTPADLADVLASCIVVAGSSHARQLARAHGVSALLQKGYGTAQSQPVLTIGKGFILSSAGGDIS